MRNWHMRWQRWLDNPNNLYRYVLVKTAFVIVLLLLLAGRGAQNVVYQGF